MAVHDTAFMNHCHCAQACSRLSWQGQGLAQPDHLDENLESVIRRHIDEEPGLGSSVTLNGTRLTACEKIGTRITTVRLIAVETSAGDERIWRLPPP